MNDEVFKLTEYIAPGYMWRRGSAHSFSVMLCFLYFIWSFGEPPGHMRSSGTIFKDVNVD